MMSDIDKLINQELMITESQIFTEEFPSDLEYPYSDDKDLSRLGRKMVTRDNEMEIYYQFGKNGGGITKELSIIGQELEDLANDGRWLVLDEPHFDVTDDVYDFKVFGRKEGVNESVLDGLKDFTDIKKFKKCAKAMLMKGISKNAIIGLITGMLALTSADDIRLRSALNDAEKELRKAKTEQLDISAFAEKAKHDWKLISVDAIATVYNAHPSQCNSDCFTTASGFRLDSTNIDAHRIIAMERTYMAKLGLSYGDVVKLEGVGEYDGVWQIQDTMNKRFKGQHKIDILTTKKYGKWSDVKIYKLQHPDEYTDFYKNKMLDSE